jgi:Protein of unknown function (DUF3306)
MATDEKKEAFLNRWSRLKKEDRQRPAVEEETPAPQLPAVDKLTPESDFTGFMHPKVEDALRRAALKKLFSDPHFNIPDPYEPYSRNFNVEDPIPPELLATLKQAEQLVFGDKTEPKEEVASADKEKPQADEPGKQDA